MPDPNPRSLPRGRHGLSRAEVEASQRDRMLAALTDAMAEKGYVGTAVQDVIKRAGVSREAFYRLFTSKHDCFMAAFASTGEQITERLTSANVSSGDPVERFARLFDAYLDFIASRPAWARLFLVEVHAVGQDAIAARLQLQQRFIDGVAELFNARTDEQRFACATVVAATASMITGPLVAGDVTGLRAIGPRVVAHVRLLVDKGILTP